MNNHGCLVLCISSEIGTPIYNAKIEIKNDDNFYVLRTNFCGIGSIKINYGEYILRISANEFKNRKFKIKFNEKCSFLSLILKSIENMIYGYIIEENKANININLLYEIVDGTYVKVKETKSDDTGLYKFENNPRGKYKVQAEE